MQLLGVQMSLAMPPPSVRERPAEDQTLAEVMNQYPQRIAFLAGGKSLNPMILETAFDEVSAAVRRQFEERAEEILGLGAVGFGEMGALHLSTKDPHPFVEPPPDHPLFLLLADIAARHGVPLDLHMEAVIEEQPTPPEYDHAPNPKTLQENIFAFERLLAHNCGARIVWAHAGWGLTGHRTVAFLQRLLGDHSNLYMQVRISKTGLSSNRPLDENGQIRPEWVNLLRSFPDRFIIGSDAKYGGSAGSGVRVLEGPRAFLDQLPPDLARRVGYENALRVYGLE